MKISVVVVEYHSLDEISRCISHYLEIIPDAEIIISSNSEYNHEEQNRILVDFPNCKWCFNDKNGGFAYAMNEGLKIAAGNYLIISNPDCIVKHGIMSMAEFLSEHSEVGAIAPRIVDEKGILQDSCRPYVTPLRFITRQLSRMLLKKEVILEKHFDYSKIQTVDWVIGAFIMVPKKVCEITRGLSTDYFMYSEDLDWCTRIRKAGFEIVYYPKSEIEYKGSRKARNSSKYARIFIKSLFTYWRKFGFISIKPKKRLLLFDDNEK